MQSKKFIETAQKVARRDRKVFDQLLDYEKTKRIRTKDKMTFTIDRATASQFKKYCRRKGYNMSAKMEQAMELLMKNQEDK
jgi:hypothetical protein